MTAEEHELFMQKLREVFRKENELIRQFEARGLRPNSIVVKGAGLERKLAGYMQVGGYSGRGHGMIYLTEAAIANYPLIPHEGEGI